MKKGIYGFVFLVAVASFLLVGGVRTAHASTSSVNSKLDSVRAYSDAHKVTVTATFSPKQTAVCCPNG